MCLFLQALAADLHSLEQLHQQNKTSQFLLKATIGKIVSLPSFDKYFFPFDKTAHPVNPMTGAMMSAFQKCFCFRTHIANVGSLLTKI